MSSEIINCCKEHVDYYESKINKLKAENASLKHEFLMVNTGYHRMIAQNKILKEACEYVIEKTYDGASNGIGLLTHIYVETKISLKKCEKVK